MSGRSGQETFLAIQRLARLQQQSTQQLLEIYVHERFLARAAHSPLAERLVLKGGMLLAALGARRATRDADLLARGIGNDIESVKRAVIAVARVERTDGAIFKTDRISIGEIRAAAEYRALRVTLPALVASAKVKLTLDISFGDPATSRRVEYPTLLDDPSFSLLGYSVESLIAEKVETMIHLGDANTRVRDYGDVYLLIRTHEVDRAQFRRALRATAAHRGHAVRPLGPLLTTLRERRQQSWAAFCTRAGIAGIPLEFALVVDGVVSFVDGAGDLCA